MNIGNRLSDHTKKKLYDKVKSKKVKREIDPEVLAERQFRETERLMGKYRDTYERKGGAIRKK